MIPVTKIFKSLLLAFVLPLYVFAGDVPDAKELTDISNDMYAANNKNYLLADALRDGFIKSGEAFSYTYALGTLTINNKPLPEPYNTQYVERMKTLLERTGGVNTVFSMNSNKLSVADLTNPQGSYSNYAIAKNKEEEARNAKCSEQLDVVLGEMYADGLIQDLQNMHFVWKGDDLRVNGKKLKGATAEKYNARLNAIDGLRSGKGAYRFSRATKG
jgi:hypothetical protein